MSLPPDTTSPSQLRTTQEQRIVKVSFCQVQVKGRTKEKNPEKMENNGKYSIKRKQK